MCFRYSHCKPGALRGLPGYYTRLVLTSGDQMMQGNFLSLPSFPSTSSYQTEQLKECQTLPGALSFQHLTSFQVLTVFPSAPGSFYLCYSALGLNSRDQLKKWGSCPHSLGLIPLDGPALSTPYSCLEGSVALAVTSLRLQTLEGIITSGSSPSLVEGTSCFCRDAKELPQLRKLACQHCIFLSSS